MVVNGFRKRVVQWEKLLKKKSYKVLASVLKKAPGVEVADFLQGQPLTECVKVFVLLDNRTQAVLFSNFTKENQLMLYRLLPRSAFALLFLDVPSDLRADFYQNLGRKEQEQILPYLPKNIRQDVLTLSSYAPETAGAIMSTDFVTLSDMMTVQEALVKIREEPPSKRMMYYLYVVNKDMQMIGFVSLQKMILVSPKTTIRDILQDTFVFAGVTEDREAVARKIEKYNLVALPILNDEEQLVGIVSYDDAMDVIRAEQTEDMERFMGIVSDEDPEDYLKTSSLHHFQKRILWVSGLFIASFASGYILHLHEELLAKFTILALYMTTINDVGGNMGTQSATVVVRALALRQVVLKDWSIVLFKELKVALFSMIVLGVLTFVKVIFISGGLEQGVYRIALIITLAVSLQVVTATFIGAMLPLFVKWLRKDPALAASPAITTIVDITGMSIYFTIAMLLLP